LRVLAMKGVATAHLFIFSTAMLALCFLLLPAFYLPVATDGEASVRKGFSSKLSTKQIRKIKNFFAKRLRRNGSSGRRAAVQPAEAVPVEPELAARGLGEGLDADRLLRMFDQLQSTAQKEALQMGLAEAPPPPPKRRSKRRAFDVELVGTEPQSMFSLRHVSRTACVDQSIDNRTLGSTLASCASKCLLAEQESQGFRSCTHFAWVPGSKRCYIYPSCERREPYPEKTYIYEKKFVHLREVGEGLCLEQTMELQLLEHQTCNFKNTRQQWLYDQASKVLRLGSDPTQCLDFYAGFEDFGVWACHDAGNHEFEYDHAGKLCLVSDHSKCVQNATADNFYLQLRFPGQASCFHFGGEFDGKTHMIMHKTCEPREEQWWLFELESLSFKHAADNSVCLNWNAEKAGFDMWKCYASPKQQFQFDEFRLTYCLRYDMHQCLQAFETLAGDGLQLRLPGESICLSFDEDGLAQKSCEGTRKDQRWMFESSSMRFVHAVAENICLEYPANALEFSAVDCSKASEQKFRYSSGTDGRKYCVGHDSERKCVQEATLGTATRLRLPRSAECLQFDGSKQALQQDPCSEARMDQKWVYDLATQVFRYFADTTQCLDYMFDEESFSAEPCHDNTPGQRFEQKYLGQYCMSNRKDLCVQQSALTFKY